MVKSETCKTCGGTGRIPVYNEKGRLIGYDHCPDCGGAPTEKIKEGRPSMNSFLNEDSWAIVELFGHAQIAGRISEQEIAGGMFLRVDVPDTEGNKGFTRFFGASAVYSITPIAEDVAKKASEVLKKAPVTVWGVIGPERQLEMRLDDEHPEDDYKDVPF